jgi:hypothetical protein
MSPPPQIVARPVRTKRVVGVLSILDVADALSNENES